MRSSALTRTLTRGVLAVITATAILVLGGLIVFQVIHPYGMRVTDYTPAPASQVVHHHG